MRVAIIKNELSCANNWGTKFISILPIEPDTRLRKSLRKIDNGAHYYYFCMSFSFIFFNCVKWLVKGKQWECSLWWYTNKLCCCCSALRQLVVMSLFYSKPKQTNDGGKQYNNGSTVILTSQKRNLRRTFYFWLLFFSPAAADEELYKALHVKCLICHPADTFEYDRAAAHGLLYRSSSLHFSLYTLSLQKSWVWLFLFCDKESTWSRQRLTQK